MNIENKIKLSMKECMVSAKGGEAIKALGSKITSEFDKKGEDPSHVKKLLVDTLAINGILNDDPHSQEEGCYDKELLYTDPKSRFSIVFVRWTKGALSPAHGHSAWGVVGVYRGEFDVICYDKVENEDGTTVVKECVCHEAKPGDISIARPDPEGIHSIVNKSDNDAYSVHIYGVDLEKEPDGLNLWYN